MEEKLRQDNSCQACPESIRLPYKSSLKDVLTKDFVSTLDCIRGLYIPGYSSEELKDFPRAFMWAKNHLETFLQSGFAGNPFSTLPRFVLIHSSCIGFCFELREDMSLLSESQADLPVAFSPNSTSWQPDIKAQTETAFIELKTHPLELKPFDPEKGSTTRTLSIIQTAFSSNWQECREEASDLLTGYLFLQYWVALKHRIK